MKLIDMSKVKEGSWYKKEPKFSSAYELVEALKLSATSSVPQFVIGDDDRMLVFRCDTKWEHKFPLLVKNGMMALWDVEYVDALGHAHLPENSTGLTCRRLQPASPCHNMYRHPCDLGKTAGGLNGVTRWHVVGWHKFKLSRR